MSMRDGLYQKARRILMPRNDYANYHFLEGSNVAGNAW